MAGFDNEVVYGFNVDFRGVTTVEGQITADGQLLIGAGSGQAIRVGTLTAGTGITITNGPGSIEISTNDLQLLNVTTTAVSYSVLPSDDYVGATAGSITISLPAAPPVGKIYLIKDQSGTAAASNITVNVTGGVINIDNATTAVININYGSLSVIWTGSQYYLI